MKVLTFLHSLEPGGVERIALRLVAAWRALGVDAPLLLGREDGAMGRDVVGALDRIVPRTRLRTASWETPWMVLVLPGVVRRVRPDVVFCAGNTYAVVAVALRLALRGRCPPIVAKVSNDLDRRDAGPVARLAYHLWLRVQGRLIDRFVAMEENAAAEIRERMAIPPERVSTIPDPALSHALLDELAAADPPARDGPGRRFVAVGRLVEQKNLTLLLQAFAIARGPDDALSIIGDGPRRSALEAQARDLGIETRVAFHGYVEEPARMLRAFDALVLSSDYEGVPAVVLEALAAGIGIVATDCSRSMRALLADGRLGTLVPIRNVARLAEAIAAVAPGERDPAPSRAHASRFAIEAASLSYLEAFGSTVENRRSGTAASGTRRRPPPGMRQCGEDGMATTSGPIAGRTP